MAESSNKANIDARPTPPPPLSPFTGVHDYWKEVDLESKRGTLDEQGLRVAENQESSLKARKKLAEATKDFRKMNADDKAKTFGPLLKSYQEEVDALTKRAKFAENAFLSAYQMLYEAPDPVAALALAIENEARAAHLREENHRMAAELEEYRTEAVGLRNQEVTMRRLEERNRQLEAQMEEKVREMVHMQERSLAEDTLKIVEDFRERERALASQLKESRASAEQLQKLLEQSQTQVFEVRALAEERMAAKQAEVEMLSEEVERLQAASTSWEREKKKHMYGAASRNAEAEQVDTSGAVDAADITRLEKELRDIEQQLMTARADLEDVARSRRVEQEAAAQVAAELRQQVQERDAALSQLQAELSQRPSPKLVEDLKRQIRILQAVRYNSVEEERWSDENEDDEDGSRKGTTDGGGTAGTGAAHGSVTGASAGTPVTGHLESLLLEKNRKLEHELTVTKVELAEKVAGLREASAIIEAHEAELSEKTQLVAKLEDVIGQWSVSGRLGAGDGGGSAHLGLGGILGGGSGRGGSVYGGNAESTIVSLLGGGRETDESGELSTAGAAGSDTGGPSMLQMVCGQRDRFRKRCHELDEDNRKLNAHNLALRGQVEKLTADNVSLVEKLRYVQGYRKTVDVERGDVGQLEGEHRKYERLYEERIDPFSEFHKKEKAERLKGLHIADRITLNSSRFFLSNKIARAFLFCYTIALHVLVFVMLCNLLTRHHTVANYHNVDILPSRQHFLKTAMAAMNATRSSMSGNATVLSPLGNYALANASDFSSLGSPSSFDATLGNVSGLGVLDNASDVGALGDASGLDALGSAAYGAVDNGTLFDAFGTSATDEDQLDY
eukprot:jgi/Mesvir1/16530/Mv10076-RA.1